jgi:hypothetical protein
VLTEQRHLLLLLMVLLLAAAALLVYSTTPLAACLWATWTSRYEVSEVQPADCVSFVMLADSAVYSGLRLQLDQW